MKITTLLLVSILVFTLTGCASIAQQRALKNECANSPILITNLAQPSTKQADMLPDGRLCPINSV